MIQTIESKSDADDKPFVELQVLHEPSDPERAWAIVRFDDPRPNRRPYPPVRYFTGMSVEEAYWEAIKLARRCDVIFVWVNDHLKLFPPCVRPKLDGGTP
jgi:hypothetical protein